MCGVCCEWFEYVQWVICELVFGSEDGCGDVIVGEVVEFECGF